MGLKSHVESCVVGAHVLSYSAWFWLCQKMGGTIEALASSEGKKHLFKRIYVKMVFNGPSYWINTPLLKTLFSTHCGGPFIIILWTWTLFLVNLNMGPWTNLFYLIKQMVTRLRSASSIFLYLLNCSLCQTSTPLQD